MKQRTAFVIGGAVGVIGLVVVFAFANLSSQQRHAVLREQTRVTADRAALAIGTRIRHLARTADRARLVRETASLDASDSTWFRIVELDETGRTIDDRSAVGLRIGVPGTAVDLTWSGPWATPTGDLAIAALARAHDSRRSGPGWVATVTSLDSVLTPDLDALLRASGLGFTLTRPDPASGQRQVVRSGTTSLDTPMEVTIPAPGGSWYLAVAPTEGWTRLGMTVATATVGGIVALLMGLLTYGFARHPDRLREEIDTTSQHLRDANRMLAAEARRRREIEHETSFSAVHDELTGLPKRDQLVNRLDRALQRARSVEGHRVGVLFFGLDRFKVVNDSLGESAGDLLLSEVARRVDRSLRPGDTLARIGGDRFGAVLYGLDETETATEVAERVCAAVTEPITLQGQEIFPSVSVGITVSETGIDRAADLLKQAEMAMYKAKDDGRGQAVFYEPALRDQAAHVLQLETDLRRAISREEFVPFYQPIVSLEDGRVVGVEVLVRWQHPLEGLLAPGRFIGMAEEQGLIGHITRWILRRAALTLSKWRRSQLVPPDFYVSVNLSGRDLAEADLVDYVRDVIEETESPPGTVRLEITESVLMANVHVALATATGLTDAGVPLLLDDFGTGYSSLSYLHRFPFDILKIDRSFVSQIAAAERDSGIVKAIVNLAADFGIKTVAEGVEQPADVERMRELGCDYAQGYHFSRPVDTLAIETLLASDPIWAMGPDIEPARRLRSTG